MLCCGIQWITLASHFGSGVGYGPFGAVGDERVESSGFWRETEKDGSLDTATLLPSEASLKSPEVWQSERRGERQSSGSSLPVEASLSASQRMRRCRMSCRV